LLTHSANDWNITVAGKGNYWSDYTGIDNDGDGFGDTPYIIDANNQDNYPLMNQFPRVSKLDYSTSIPDSHITVVVIKKKMLYPIT
jgi:nitrous oxidase accessory protein NosD